MFKGDRNFAVGLFVSIAIAAFIFFVIWLTGRTGNEEMKRYSLLFSKDISGLSVGGPVKYMGMNIGTVIEMELESNHGIRIRVDIEESSPEDMEEYLRTYRQPGALRAGFSYYRAINKDVAHNESLLKRNGKLKMPVLALGGGKGFGRGVETLESLQRAGRDD